MRLQLAEAIQRMPIKAGLAAEKPHAAVFEFIKDENMISRSFVIRS